MYYSSRDYAEAEKIILGKSSLYDLGDAGILSLKRGENPRPKVEAALVDIFLSYDNEGNRVLLRTPLPEDAYEAGGRYADLEKHVDRNKRRAAWESLQKRRNESKSFPGFEDRPKSDPLRYEMAALEGDLEKVELNMREVPGLKILAGKQDTPAGLAAAAQAMEDYYDQNADGEWPERQSPPWLKDPQHWADNLDRYDVLSDWKNYKYGEAGDIADAEISMLSQAVRDNAAYNPSLYLEFDSERDAASLRQKFPRAMGFVDHYMTVRRAAMKREMQEMDSLVSVEREEQKRIREGARAIRSSPNFAKHGGIWLMVKPDLLELVRKIVRDRKAEEARRPNPGRKQAHRARPERTADFS